MKFLRKLLKNYKKKKELEKIKRICVETHIKVLSTIFKQAIEKKTKRG
jgi:hypothetical protein